MKKLSYEISHLDSYDGQNNYNAGIYIEEGIIGMVEFVTFDDEETGDKELTVSNIVVRPEYRRKGVGARLMQHVKAKFPEYTYKPSGMTDLGAKFKHKEIKDTDVLKENHIMKGLIKEGLKKMFLFEEITTLIEKEIGVGPALTKKLGNIGKPYADKLLQFLKSDNISDKANIDIIEYSDDDNKTISAYSKDRDGKTTSRKYKVGKLLKFLGANLGEYKGYELEELIAHLKKGSTDDFKVVDGDKILWAYHCDNYDEGETMGSCMRYAAAQTYFKIYTENPDQVKCIVLLNPNNDKVRGRALLWKTDDGSLFMDKIYLTNSQYKNLFLLYAEQHGYVTKTNSTVTIENFSFDEYPYLDTFKYLNVEDGILMDETDGEESTLVLDDTGGSANNQGELVEYGSHEGERVPEDDVVYLSYQRDGDYVEGSAHIDDVTVINNQAWLTDDCIKLYNDELTPKYGDDADMAVTIYVGPYEDELARHDDTYRLTPEHYGEDAYILTQGAEDYAVELHNDTYEYTWALKSDVAKLYDQHYEEENGLYAMKDDVVVLFDNKYGDSVYGLVDDCTEIKLKGYGEVWVLDDDIDEFDDIRLESVMRMNLSTILENTSKTMTGYKVMPLKDGKIVSGANSRLETNYEVGKVATMPGNGIFMSLDKQYVLDYYSELADEEVLITFEFIPSDIISGNLTDKDTEFTVPRALVRNIEKITVSESTKSMSLNKLFETKIIDEVAINQSNISEDIGLFIIPGNALILYDMTEYDDSDRFRGMRGVITLRNEGNVIAANKIAAKKGFGPIMFELAMQHIYPNAMAIERDGDVRDAALSVLGKFVDGINGGVEVNTLNPSDDGYSDCKEFTHIDDIEGFCKIYNSQFKMSDKSLYNKLKAEGDEFLQDVGSEFINELEDYASEFFDQMYGNS